MMHLDFLRYLRRGVLGACVLAVVASGLAARAERASTNYALTVSTERAGAIYRRGEEVAFKIRLFLDQQPLDNAKVQWTISKDGVPPTKRGTLQLADGSAIIFGKLDEPGFLQCRVTFQTPAGTTLHALAGAGVDPLQIKPSLPVPEDFDAFWSAQKQKLARVPVNARLTPVQSPQREVECFDLLADCLGAPVSGYLARPKAARARSLPAILTVQGAGVRSSNLAGAAGWAKDGFLALDINAHGIPNGKPDQFYEDLANGALKDYRTQGNESRDTIYFLGMFLRVLRAIDFLTAQPEWDGRTLVVYGGSQGGAQAFAAAGLDRRVTFFAAGVPAMCDHTGVAAGRICGWPKLVPIGPDGKPDAKALEAARYYDAVNFATRATAAGIVTVGFIDPTCPPTTVYAAYNALKGKKEIYNDPPSTHKLSACALDAMRQAVLRHVEAMKLAKGTSEK
jgi:cephalosporin-C deacetylase